MNPVRLCAALIFALFPLMPAGFTSEAGAEELTLTSPSFKNGRPIPIQFSCYGDTDGISPALSWKNAPKGVKSFAILVSDKDTWEGTFYHWGRYNIPAKTRKLAEGAQVSGGSVDTENALGDMGYAGVCPPEEGGTHHYTFRVYALRTKLKATEKIKLDEASQLAFQLKNKRGAYKRYVLATGTLTGTYTGSWD